MIIKIENVNDLRPEFTHFPSETVDIREEENNDTITTITATDPEFDQNDQLTLVISQPELNKPFNLTQPQPGVPTWNLAVTGEDN